VFPHVFRAGWLRSGDLLISLRPRECGAIRDVILCLPRYRAGFDDAVSGFVTRIAKRAVDKRGEMDAEAAGEARRPALPFGRVVVPDWDRSHALQYFLGRVDRKLSRYVGVQSRRVHDTQIFVAVGYRNHPGKAAHRRPSYRDAMPRRVPAARASHRTGCMPFLEGIQGSGPGRRRGHRKRSRFLAAVDPAAY
jgi:hypothetical protein